MRTKMYEKNLIKYIKFNKNAEHKPYSHMMSKKKISFIRKGIMNEDGFLEILSDEVSFEDINEDDVFIMAYENDKIKDGCRLFKNLGPCAESEGFLVYKICEIGRGLL